MAVTGTGTQADPFVVHSYSEFASLSGHAPVAAESVYIKWFDEPNQVLDCNDYGSEFKWGAFTDNAGNYGTVTFYIDLNGCTIKNFLIADGVTMFEGHYISINGNLGKIVISNGSLRNVFMGSAASKVCGNYVEFHDVSLSVNASGSTVVPFDGNGNLIIDNVALYLVGSTLNTSIMTGARITDTDIELHVGDQNQQNMFPNCSFTDCRFQGKIGGKAIRAGNYPSFYFTVFGLNTNGVQTNDTVLNNCVVDVDISDMTLDWSGALVYFYVPSNGATLNTNIFCNSHCPGGYSHPSDWNYISHTLMRNGAYLNSKGFTVVEVVEG